MSSHQNSYFASSTFSEQRLFLRKRVSLPLPIELLPGKEVWLDDLGEGGLSVSGSSRLELGASTFLTFDFPEAKSKIEAAGVVAWCDSTGRAGVRFTRIKPDSTAALKRWLKSDLVTPAGVAESPVRSAESVFPLSRHGREIADLREEISSVGRGPGGALAWIAERMLHLTRATGAALALLDGAEVVCRASAGNAPAVGVRLNPGSLTGQCYRTGNIVTLADTENDFRVNVELRRQLDFRSLLIVPVVSANQPVGVVEVLSSVPGNFEGGDVLLLAAIAELVADIYQNLKTPSVSKALAARQR